MAIPHWYWLIVFHVLDWLVTGWWLSMYWTWLVSRVNGWFYGWLYGWGQRRHIYGRFHSLPATYSTLLLLPSSCNILRSNDKSQIIPKNKICFRVHFILRLYIHTFILFFSIVQYNLCICICICIWCYDGEIDESKDDVLGANFWWSGYIFWRSIHFSWCTAKIVL